MWYFPERATFKQNDHEGKVNHVDIWRKGVSGRETSSAKVQRWECAWMVPETVKKLGYREGSE